MHGNKYGTHRVMYPKGVLPQPALRLNNNFSKIYDNEILCDVLTLNIDAASFEDIKRRANNDEEKIKEIIMHIVNMSGKHKNPRTGSGGVFIGQVSKIGNYLKNKINLREGDLIVSLVSLSLTPLRVDKIYFVGMDNDQVDIKGQAILFESSIWAKLPEDIPGRLALAVLDVCGAPAQVERLVKPNDVVAVLGARGKSGLLCCYQAKKNGGHVVAIVHSNKNIEDVNDAQFIDEVIIASADNALEMYEKVGPRCDVVVNCVSQKNCEMGAIMITKDRGKVYFFSMATDFTKAALGAEGIKKDIDMMIGNGYCKGHAKLALDIIRKDAYLRSLYEKRYCR